MQDLCHDGFVTVNGWQLDLVLIPDSHGAYKRDLDMGAKSDPGSFQFLVQRCNAVGVLPPCLEASPRSI